SVVCVCVCIPVDCTGRSCVCFSGVCVCVCFSGVCVFQWSFGVCVCVCVCFFILGLLLTVGFTTFRHFNSTFSEKYSKLYLYTECLHISKTHCVRNPHCIP